MGPLAFAIRDALRGSVATAHPVTVIFTLALTIVGSVGLLACGLAARQGLAIDPAAALRDE